MGKLFTVDISAIPTHEERYNIMKLFDTSFDVYEEWVPAGPSDITVYRFEIFWPYDSQAPFPKLPSNVTITEK